MARHSPPNSFSMACANFLSPHKSAKYMKVMARS
nr:MAG TPA: hypothetical protein [Caudoviricetes sp.]